MSSNLQQKVIASLKKIPKGRVTTYKAIGTHLHTKAYRAIGSACKKNLSAPIVPCHRVVAADGSLGGYQGKMNNTKKIALLKKEGVVVSKGKVVDFKKKLFKF